MNLIKYILHRSKTEASRHILCNFIILFLLTLTLNCLYSKLLKICTVVLSMSHLW